MKAIKQVLVEKYLGKHLDLRVRLFNILAVGGIVISLTMAAGTVLTGAGFIHFLVNIILAAVSFGLLYLSITTGNYQLGYILTVVFIFLILFPAAFFVSDGYRGGMPTFFVFAVTISVFMLRGRTAFIVTALELVLYVALCVYAYFRPDSVQHFASEGDMLQDIILSFVTVSISLGIIMHYHFRLNYEQQKELEKAREEALALSRVKTSFLTNTAMRSARPSTWFSA